MDPMPEHSFPPDCPVTCRGANQQGEYLFSDPLGRQIAIHYSDFNASALRHLFIARPSYPRQQWWRVNPRDGEIVIDVERAITALMGECQVQQLAGASVTDEPQSSAWSPVKKAIWRVVTGEWLNDGYYINAYDLTDKIHAAVQAELRPTAATLAGHDADPA